MTNVKPPTAQRDRVQDKLAHDPPIDTVVELLSAQAARNPDREFIRFGDQSWTFGDLETWTNRLANRLATEDGVAVGDRVAIMLPNGVQWPVAWLATLKAGAVAVPVNCSYQRADLAFVLRDSGASVVITDAEHAPLIEEVLACAPELAWVRITGADTHEAVQRHRATGPRVEITGSTLANLQYTSGTTGFPKACMLTHDYWTRLGWICAAAAELCDEDVVLTAQPFSYMDPQWNAVLCLTIGAPLVVLPRFSASGFMPDVRRHGATFIYVLGSMPTLLLKQPPDAADRDNDLRLVFCSGIPASMHALLEARWGAPWREIFGMTESGADLISLPSDSADVGTGRLGHPIPTKQIRVVDTRGHDVDDGVAGELTTSGKPLMLGYWNRPQDTERVLRQGWLHTGDLAVRESGGYRLVGRIKDMVRRGGENIASAEVERVLENHGAVVGCAVVGVSDDLFGEEVKAYIQLMPGLTADRATAEQIISAARTQLARFKVPRYVEFVADLPRTPSERVSKPALAARSAAQIGTTYDMQHTR